MVFKEYLYEEDITISRAMETAHGGSLFFRALGFSLPDSQAAKQIEMYQRPYPDEFFDIRTKCKNECYKCNYCKKILENI